MTSRADRALALGILGLPQDAGHDEIVRAYRRLSKATHPDATGRTDREADRRFATITDAYRRLAEDLPDEARPNGARPDEAPRPDEALRPHEARPAATRRHKVSHGGANPGGASTDSGTPESGHLVVPGVGPEAPLIVAGPASVTAAPLARRAAEVPLVAGPVKFSPLPDPRIEQRRLR